MEIDTVDTNVTPSLHPANIESIEGFNQDTAPYCSQVLGAFRAAYDGLGDVHRAREAADADLTLTEEARLLRVADFSEKHQNIITKKFDAAHANLNRTITALEEMLSNPLKQSAERVVIAGEVRAFVKGLSVAERNKFFNDRQKAGDIESLQAVLGAPSFLSGITDEERAVRTRIFHEIKSPDVALRLKVLHEARKLIETRGPLVFGEIGKAVGANPHKIAKLRAATTAAQKAFILRSE